MGVGPMRVRVIMHTLSEFSAQCNISKGAGLCSHITLQHRIPHNPACKDEGLCPLPTLFVSDGQTVAARVRFRG